MRKPFITGGLYGVHGNQLEHYEKVWQYCLDLSESIGKPTKDHKGVLITTEDGLYCWRRKRNTKFYSFEYGKSTSKHLPVIIFDVIIWLGDDFEKAKIELATEIPQGEEGSIMISNINKYLNERNNEKTNRSTTN